MNPQGLLYATLWLGGSLFSHSAEEKYWWGMALGFFAPIVVAWFVSNMEDEE